MMPELLSSIWEKSIFAIDQTGGENDEPDPWNHNEILRSGRLVTFVLAVAGVLLLSASEAKAGCGDPFKAQASPMLPSTSHQDDNEGNGPATIVGLWHVHYTASDVHPSSNRSKPGTLTERSLKMLFCRQSEGTFVLAFGSKSAI
jgi:hypothetical protein